MTSFPETVGVKRPAGRDRIVVGGVDVTYFRGFRTPTPSYLLTEPLAYGSTTIGFPQVHASAEIGAADLTWLRHGAEVLIQRVMPDASVVTDYVGTVTSINVEGRNLTADVGGQLAGRLAARNRQTPIVPRVQDAGLWADQACQLVNVTFLPRLGPTTGIDVVDEGEQSELAWAQNVCSQAQTLSGDQWTLMPSTWGVRGPWEFRLKDRATTDFTLFPDDARVVLSLVNDALEQPNTIYGSCTTPDGVRVRGAKYPGLFQGTTPDYPIAGGSSFGPGTTDADTVNGDGVTVLRDKLVQAGYLAGGLDFNGTFTAAMGAAVQDLRDDVGLADSTSINTAAWDALFDVSRTGWTIRGARIFPMAQRSNVREFNYTSNGSIAGKNPDFDVHALEVDRNIDAGTCEKATLRKWTRGLLARSAGKNWAGTIRLNLAGGFAGHHNNETGLTSADIVSYRDIRPGMNAWLPYFDGGTLVHVSSVSVDDQGAMLTVDTQARDSLELSQVIARNAESRRSQRREWLATNRGRQPSGSVVGRDEYFGQLDNDVHCPANQWTHFPVVMGLRGQVNRIDVQTANSPALFALLVTRTQVSEATLNHRLPTPMHVDSNGQSDWETSDWVATNTEDKVILYAAGTDLQPLGTWPKKTTSDSGAALTPPVTGRHRDDATWPYETGAFDSPVCWVAIWPDRDTVVKRGQVLWPQMDDANA